MSNLLSNYEQVAQQGLPGATSLPFGVYQNSEIFAVEQNRIFRNDWVFVCAELELANPGDYYAFTLAGEPVVVIRGKDNNLRALSNICRHRGTPLLDEGFGQIGKVIICPYHAWSYHDDGRLNRAPFTQSGEVDAKTHCLPTFHLQSILGLVFIYLGDNPAPLASRFEGLEQYTSIFEPSRFNAVSPSSLEQWQANWKLIMENGMESYHLFKVHKETLETVTPSKLAYHVGGSSEWTVTGGEMQDDSGWLTKMLRGSYPKAYDHYLLLSLPPNFVGIMTYDSLGWLSVLPVDSQTSQVRAAAISDSALGREDAASKEFTEAFFAEDKVICERVQRGMSARVGKGGTLVEKERVVVDFHQYLASRLFGMTPTPHYDNPEATVFHAAP